MQQLNAQCYNEILVIVNSKLQRYESDNDFNFEFDFKSVPLNPFQSPYINQKLTIDIDVIINEFIDIPIIIDENITWCGKNPTNDEKLNHLLIEFQNLINAWYQNDYQYIENAYQECLKWQFKASQNLCHAQFELNQIILNNNLTDEITIILENNPLTLTFCYKDYDENHHELWNVHVDIDIYGNIHVADDFDFESWLEKYDLLNQFDNIFESQQQINLI